MFILYWSYFAGITLINWSSNLEIPTLDIEIKHSRLTILNTKITAVKHFHKDLISYVTNIKRESPHWHWAAMVHLNFRAGSTFPVTVCTVPSSVNRTSRCNKVDAVRLNASYKLNLLLLTGDVVRARQRNNSEIFGYSVL